MIHSDSQLLDWLRQHCQRDRALGNALALPRDVVVTTVPGQSWSVRVVSQRGVEYNVVIVADPVGMPERWYRVQGESC